MNSKYVDLFDDLIKAYYDGTFDKTLIRVMGGHDKSPQETFKIITSLCGVDIPYDNNYLYNLKKAITHYSTNKHIIEKLEDCSINCIPENNGDSKCQSACPFSAINYDFDKRTTIIDYTICCECGLCIDACSDGKIIDKIDFIPIKELINQNETVIAAVSPSIVGQFGPDITMDKLREVFIKLGFKDMVEVAFAADLLTVKDSMQFNDEIKTEKDFIISSGCCPIWINMLKNSYKKLIPHISPSISPMIAAGKIIKQLNKGAKVVYISPCIAKKAECKEEDVLGIIDFVITYEELDSILNTVNLDLSKLKGIPAVEYASKGGRLYAISSGVSIAISEVIDELYPNRTIPVKYISADGIENCKELLDKALAGELDGNLLEGMACNGGCVGGPKTLIPIEEGTIAASKYALASPIKVPLHSKALDNILNSINLPSVEKISKDELDSLLTRNLD